MQIKTREEGPVRKGTLVRNGAIVYVRRTSRGSWKDVNCFNLEYSDLEIEIEEEPLQNSSSEAK